MEDIIASVAWEEDGWHRANYWAYENGHYSVDHYADGDHDYVDVDDLPTDEEVAQSWRDYAAFVTQTGTDPLGEYYVKRSFKIRERWQFMFNKSIVGPVLIRARRAGVEIDRSEPPHHVREYLNLKDRSVRLADFANWQEFTTVLNVKPMCWVTIHIEREQQRKASVVEKELRTLARRYVA